MKVMSDLMRAYCELLGIADMIKNEVHASLNCTHGDFDRFQRVPTIESEYRLIDLH